ncbi:SGNH/GDSL hydrolase family protein [Actinomadura atramentaria]|uniref:SGNH/GDSL hydrolase family protein n=1 Tax=Actinomadura atramentaria TaxID=1990 RepID=UPI00146C1C88|nr:SGNH/GDSL hydrolase family protein [Actinomadura atramentaria]
MPLFKRSHPRTAEHSALRRRLARAAGSAVAACALVTAGAATAAAESAPTYYVSLGDSLAAGYQPDAKKDTDVSYTDVVYRTLKQSDPNLQHIRLGCSGETTQSMINGGICSYDGAKSQLQAAVNFLRAHPGQVKYVTEDIGANNVDKCLPNGTLDIGCLINGIFAISSDVTSINKQLRDAGGDTPRYVGMTYYDPMLAYWLQGGTSQWVGGASAIANNILSFVLTSADDSAGFATADVATAFANNDFGNEVELPNIGKVPHNVAQICQWTWMCTQYHDIHANPTGHQVLAETFLPLLTGGAKQS